MSQQIDKNSHMYEYLNKNDIEELMFWYEIVRFLIVFSLQFVPTIILY